MTQPVTTTDLEELLEAEVPCHKCGQEAALRSHGHWCQVEPGPVYRCLNCYLPWLQRISAKLAERGKVRCEACKVTFPTVESFSDYRPF